MEISAQIMLPKYKGRNSSVAMQMGFYRATIRLQKVVNAVYNTLNSGERVLEDGIMGMSTTRHVQNVSSLCRQHTEYLQQHVRDIGALNGLLNINAGIAKGGANAPPALPGGWRAHEGVAGGAAGCAGG